MKRLILGYCLVMALGMSVPTAGAAEEPSAAGRAAATELLSVMNLERTMMGVAVAMADAMIQQNAALQPYREVMLECVKSRPSTGHRPDRKRLGSCPS